VRDPFGPEISDLIIDYDPSTLARKPVRKADVLARLEEEGRSAPIAVARTLRDTNGFLDDAEVDGVLVRSHLELQRLHEEFSVGATMRLLLAPMLDLVREATKERPIRVVDIGCGLGFILRWLAKSGELGDDIELLGVDYNRTFVEASSTLAKADGLKCRFDAANAFKLEAPAHVYISTGVLHHFRGEDLVKLFSEHERSNALAFVHVDIRPSWMAPIGSWIFHQARMREPLAKWDGYWSAVRAHTAETLVSAVTNGAPGFGLATLDARPGLHAMVRIFHAIVGVRSEHESRLPKAYAALGKRLRIGA